MSASDDRPVACVGEGYMGEPGRWCYWDEDEPCYGSVGPFASREEAEYHAREAGYRVEAAAADGGAA